MLKDPEEAAAKWSLMVMIQLYSKNIWKDENTVNVRSSACTHDKSKIAVAACKFFLMANWDVNDNDSSSSEDEETKKLMNHGANGIRIGTKKWKNLEKQLKSLKRKEWRRNKIKITDDFLPIDMLWTPQELGDRLFNRIRRSKEPIEVKLVLLKLLGRLIGRHKLIILPFYTYMTNINRNIGDFLALIAESVHDNVPAEELHPLTNKIVDEYVSEQQQDVNIVMALNCLWEMASWNHGCLTMP